MNEFRHRNTGMGVASCLSVARRQLNRDPRRSFPNVSSQLERKSTMRIEDYAANATLFGVS